jgi:hypothetical protein
LASVNAFLPLLAWNVRRTAMPLDEDLLTHLRSAYLTEELRWRRYRSICESAFGLLGAASIPFIALKGAAVSELVYPLPFLRHSDDIDALVRGNDLERAARALIDAGWRENDRPPVLPNPLHLQPLSHASGVPIELHRRLLIPYYELPYDLLWERHLVARVADLDVRVLSDADALLHICAHGMYGRPNLKWVVDAWFILQTCARLDWSIFASTAISARLEFPMHHALRYLTNEMGAVVPTEVLEELELRASRTGIVGRHVARPWPGGAAERVVHGGPLWRWLRTAWRRVFPPPIQFALHYDVRFWMVPFYYVYRLARYAWIERLRS